jgi:hypothetical protein
LNYQALLNSWPKSTPCSQPPPARHPIEDRRAFFVSKWPPKNNSKKIITTLFTSDLLLVYLDCRDEEHQPQTTKERFEMTKTNSLALPKTWNAIKANFPGSNNKGLRDKIFQSAIDSRQVSHLAGSVALSASGKASLEAVQAVVNQELAELGA